MAERLRIVLDARATTAHFPGIARATLGLLAGLRQIEHEHQIAVLAHADAPAATLPLWADPRLIRIPTSAAPLGLQQQWQLPLLARALRPDLWHAPYYVRPFVGVPCPVVTVFDAIGRVLPEALPGWRARLFFEVALRLSLRGARAIITSSQATRADLIRLYGLPAQQITVVPLAADAQFQPRSELEVAAIRARYGLPPRYLLYLGSNKPHKNLVTLVRAFARLDTDAALVIAGRWDPRYPQARQIANAGTLAERVHFIHDIADLDVPALLTGALAFVFPSRYEGFGLPPLEALACGTPVIAARTSSLPEVIGEAGLLVVPEIAPLAAAMQTVLDDAGLRERLRVEGLSQAQRFSWSSTARATLAVYEHIAGSRSLRLTRI